MSPVWIAFIIGAVLGVVVAVIALALWLAKERRNECEICIGNKSLPGHL